MRASCTTNIKPEDLSLDPQHLCKEPDAAACSSNTVLGRQRKTDAWSLLASQSNYTTEVSDAVKPYLKEKV